MLAGAILSEVVATLSLRASEGFSRAGPTALMAVGYLVSFVLLAQALKRGWASEWPMRCGPAWASRSSRSSAECSSTSRCAVTAAGIALIIGGVVTVESSTATR